MGGIFEKWVGAQFEYLRRLFSGTLDTQPMLLGLLANGLALDVTRNLDLGLFVKEAQKLMYGQMLPVAWIKSTKRVNLEPRSLMPMVL